MKHPPFVSAGGPAGEDYLSEDGARALASRIRAAWAAVGHDVQCVPRCVVRSYVNSGSSVWTVEMPGLVNGMPVS